ncbi:hypothetical protein IP88_02985 [alpha proteobacterium AAP81b]|nr:hypothetical protein IP88_02985 [alpha proteobacterium AAP81b]
MVRRARSNARVKHARAILAIAVPAMLTNAATALFGLADIWVIGQAGSALPQAAVELGAKLMLGLLAAFNFLRMGTVALTATAIGGGESAAPVLARALALAGGIAVALLAAGVWLVPAGIDLLGGTGALAKAASAYVAWRYAGGAFWLLGAVLAGALIGQRRVRAVLAIEIAANIVHVGLDVGLVLGLGWGVAGVGIATLVSEGVRLAALAAVALDRCTRAALAAAARDAATWARPALLRLFSMNRDLFLRTLLLTAAILALTRAGADAGPVTLAANAVIYQLFALSALLLDGYESAAQVLCAEAAGARDRRRFTGVVRTCLLLGMATALAISAGHWLAGDAIVAGFSRDPAVIAAVAGLYGWALLAPVAGVTAYVLDGAFIGAGWTRAMLLTMAAALALYLPLLALAADADGLWLALTAFVCARAGGQLVALQGCCGGGSGEEQKPKV